MKKRLMIIGCSLLNTLSLLGTEKYPDFTWDRVPVCLHLSNGTSDFTPSQIRYIARFPIVCIEKNQAYKKYGNKETGILNAARSIKEQNKACKVLFYWNSRIDYVEFYNYGDILKEHPEWIMTNQNGDWVTVPRSNRRTYDVTNASFRTWWCSIPVRRLTCENLDGVFIDAVLQYIARPERKEKRFGKEKFAKIQHGIHAMLIQLKESVGAINC